MFWQNRHSSCIFFGYCSVIVLLMDRECPSDLFNHPKFAKLLFQGSWLYFCCRSFESCIILVPPTVLFCYSPCKSPLIALGWYLPSSTPPLCGCHHDRTSQLVFLIGIARLFKTVQAVVKRLCTVSMAFGRIFGIGRNRSAVNIHMHNHIRSFQDG